MYSDRHTLDDYEMEPLLESLCAENQEPISYHFVYIDSGGKLACFDLAEKSYEVWTNADIRRMFSSEVLGAEELSNTV